MNNTRQKTSQKTKKEKEKKRKKKKAKKTKEIRNLPTKRSHMGRYDGGKSIRNDVRSNDRFL